MLDTRVCDLLPGFEVNGKETITLLNLLLHNAGFPADPDPGYCILTFFIFPMLLFSYRGIRLPTNSILLSCRRLLLQCSNL